ncbi:Beta-cyclopiazonate dehydrogenase [Lecanosticta acicola]|uniref:Beta-cyclopiazonate dehydrogenase n=1 Tax=Lecanosticta acicola TaxID=111012 RepID=A0AAI8Z8Q9_9PEZI|nr:Beta-cyclopiazonate dehydrogenase [Lecanosticta acicola]
MNPHWLFLVSLLSRPTFSQFVDSPPVHGDKKDLAAAAAAAAKTPLISTTTTTRDVVILGGGAAGSYAAARLKQHGHSVALVETREHLGGHSQTFHLSGSSGAPVEYGVVFFHDNAITRQFMRSYDIEPYRNSITDPSHRIDFYDLQTGERTDFQPPEPGPVLAALQKYAGILQSKYGYLEAGYELPDPVPEELLIPFEDFVRRHGLGDLLNIAFQMGQGYGDFLRKPTLYAMKIVSHEILQQVFQGSLLRMTDNSRLYARIESQLNASGDLFASSMVVNTDRERDVDGYISIHVRDLRDNSVHLIRACQALVTIPPLVQHLDPGLALDPLELSVFSRFECHGYWAGVLRNAGLPDLEVQNVDLKNPGGVPSLPGMYVFEATDSPDVHTFWYGADGATGDLDEADVREAVLETIDRLHAARGRQYNVSAVEFLAFGNYSPFACMANVSAIRSGFYRDLYGLQGYRNTWWSGAAWHTHDSSKLWSFTEAIVSRMIEARRSERQEVRPKQDL